MELFDKTLTAIERKLDLHLKRHAVLSSNVANSETPGYKAREVDFAGELQKVLGGTGASLDKTNSLHMDLTSATGPHVVLDHSGAIGANGNNVDMDISLGKLSANSRGYTHAANLLTMKLRILKMAARGRGGF